MRTTYVWCPVAGRMVRKGDEASARRDNGGPAWLAAPGVWGVMPETKHTIDGKVYDSRERYQAVTRAHGALEIGRGEMRRLVERGPKPEPMKPVGASIREALQRHGW